MPTVADLKAVTADKWPIKFEPTNGDAALVTSGEDGPADGIIFINPGLDDDLQLRAIIHELAEYLLIVDQPGLWDNVDEPSFAHLYTGDGCPQDIRHAGAVKVEEQMATRWGIDACSKETADERRARFRGILNAVWFKYHPPTPDLERVIEDIVL
jgi:hypothetical protein